MAGYFKKVKTPWTKQPQTNVTARDDVRLSFAANYISNAAPDLVGRRIPTVAGVIAATPAGLGVKLSSTTDAGLVYSSNPVIPTSSAAFTVIVTGTWAAEARLSDLFFYGDESGGNYPQHSILLNADSTNYNAVSSGTLSALTYDGGFQTTIKSTAGVIDGLPHTIGWRNGANAALSLWMDGRDVSSTKTGGTYTLASTYPLYVNQTNVPANGRGVTSPTSGVFVFPRILSDGEMALYTRNPWLLIAPQERRVFVSVASSGITGTFSVTESVDVPAISGLVNHTGSLAVTESSDTTSISGSIAHLGNLSVTESSDTFAASGTVSGSATITGSLVITEISDTASLIGKVAHTGALVVTETADTVSFNGLVTHTGALAVTESADIVAITGGSQITITGSIAITESPDVANFRGPSGNTFSQEVEFRKFYVRKGKKILLFDSVDEAEEYIKAEQVAEEAIAKAKVSSRQERRKIKKRIIKDVLPAESIDTDWLAEMMQRFAINFDLPKLLAEQDYNRVMEIHAMAKAMQDDEDDIEMLLMWG